MARLPNRHPRCAWRRVVDDQDTRRLHRHRQHQRMARRDTSSASIDAASLPGDLSEKWSQAERGYTTTDAAFRRSLGKWLQLRHGRYAGGWKLVRAGRDSHVDKPLYAVEPPSGWAKP